jgi:pimeloyl-ACP methyl ester carboxylesterase
MGKVVLVGHSMAGMVISAVAEKIPERIGKLVYLAAFVPANGQSLQDLAFTDSTSLLGAAIIPSKDGLTLDIKTENIAPIFVQDGSDVIKKLVLNNYRLEPAIPFTNKAVLSAANFGKVDKYYIHTLKDQALGYNLQKRMVATAGIRNTLLLDTGHSPFLSKPNLVIQALMKIVE